MNFSTLSTALTIIRTTVIALVILYSKVSQAIITVEISPNFSSIYTTKVAIIKPGAADAYVELSDTALKDSYLIDLTVTNGKARAVVVDKHDEEISNPHPVPIINQVVQGRAFIEIPYIRSGSGGIFFVMNEQRRDIEAKWRIYRFGIRPPSATKQVKELIETLTKVINKFYKTPDITLKVEPCGNSNAYAGKDIIICSELVSELSDEKYAKALHVVIAHELAHVLLKYWNLPGHNNEDLADEFALSLLGNYRESITSFIEWLETHDSVQEALYQIAVGDRHSISIQRARNLKDGLEHIDEIMNRWDNILKPYLISK